MPTHTETPALHTHYFSLTFLSSAERLKIESLLYSNYHLPLPMPTSYMFLFGDCPPAPPMEYYHLLPCLGTSLYLSPTTSCWQRQSQLYSYIMDWETEGHLWSVHGEAGTARMHSTGCRLCLGDSTTFSASLTSPPLCSSGSHFPLPKTDAQDEGRCHSGGTWVN